MAELGQLELDEASSGEPLTTAPRERNVDMLRPEHQQMLETLSEAHCELITEVAWVAFRFGCDFGAEVER
jgi:hypothetical protein